MTATLYRLVLAAFLALALPAVSIAQPAGPLPAPSADIEYTAKPRDTMIGIARRYLIEGQRFEVQRALWEHNKLRDKDQIAPGQVIRIPENWMKDDANSIQLAHVEGEVQSKGQPLRPGAKLAPGDDVKTGGNGYVTIKLADGSTLLLQPGSDLAIDGVKKSPLAPAADAQFTLKKGRVEASVAKRSPGGALQPHGPVRRALREDRREDLRQALAAKRARGLADEVRGLRVHERDTQFHVHHQRRLGQSVQRIADEAPHVAHARRRPPHLVGRPAITLAESSTPGIERPYPDTGVG